MKTIILILILQLFPLFQIAKNTKHETQKVDIKEETSTTLPRSEDLPDVWIDAEKSCLYVQYPFTNFIFEVEITNATNKTVYHNYAIADGRMNNYNLVNLPRGYYSVAIANDHRLFMVHPTNA